MVGALALVDLQQVLGKGTHQFRAVGFAALLGGRQIGQRLVAAGAGGGELGFGAVEPGADRAPLRAGMTVTVSIDTEREPQLARLFNRAVAAVRGEE